MKTQKITINGKKISNQNTGYTESSFYISEESELIQVVVFEEPKRDRSNEVSIDLKPEESLEIELEDGTVWLVNAETISDLFPAIEVGEDGSISIPNSIQTENESKRGVVGIALKVLKVIFPKFVEKSMKKLVEIVDKKVLGSSKEGIYKVNLDLSFGNPDFENLGEPYLLFLHGTVSSFEGSYGDLRSTNEWKELWNIYGSNIITFEHMTLSKHPLENVIDLIKNLPDGVKLHIVSQSRGGLVGEVLCRMAYSETSKVGFSENAKQILVSYNRKEELKWIDELEKLVFKKDKKFTIEKFVRVACPAAGTTLASKKLSTSLNIIFNLVTRIPILGPSVFSVLADLVKFVVAFKDDPNMLTGLECQIPDSPFIKLLNSPKEEDKLNQPLVVIAGNRTFDTKLKGLLAIASKVFYQRKNDLVVDTESMYKGGRRTNKIQYFFNQNNTFSHFRYFEDNASRSALLNALKTSPDENIPGFIRSFQDSVNSADRANALGLEYGDLYGDSISGKKPILLLLPGIMGSNLRDKKSKLWINYFNMMAGELDRLTIDKPEIEASSLVATSYKKFKNFFSNSYDVVTFPFDWRLPLTDSSAILNSKIEEILNAGQKVKVVAHSMGGVLFREFILNHENTWKKLNSSENFRAVYLGVPFWGSFRIPYVLFGLDKLIKLISAIDIPHSKKELVDIFCQYPGILNLLPHNLDERVDFSDSTKWLEMANAFGDSSWPIPPKKQLEDFGEYRRNSLDNFDKIDFSKAAYIAGKDKSTICDYKIVPYKGEERLKFYSTDQGDASVTWEYNIPQKLIDSNDVYYVPITHGELANTPHLFTSIEELLSTGNTKALSNQRPSSRAEKKIFEAPDEIIFDKSEVSLTKSILGFQDRKEGVQDDKLIEVSVSNGDLSHSKFVVLAGHFKGDGILSAEKAIDYYLNNTLSKRHLIGNYPQEIGESKFFKRQYSNGNVSKLKGAIVIGLGKYGNLTPTTLAESVEKGIIDFLLEIPKGDASSNSKLGISPLFIACNYGGLSVESSAMAILQGIKNANSSVLAIDKNASVIELVEFIERYEDISLSSLYALLSRERIQENDKLFFLKNSTVNRMIGSMKRISLENADSWWERISVSFGAKAEENSLKKLIYDFTTNGARVERNEEFIDPIFLDSFLERISKNNNWNERDKRVAFEYLIPTIFKERLGQKSNIIWVVDKETAIFPWELLSDSGENSKPFCINAGMIRQLSTSDNNKKRKTVITNTALIVADPKLKGMKGLGQLSGAAAEGALVVSLLNKNGFGNEDITAHLGSDALTILGTIHSSQFKIMHLAGHGISNAEEPMRSGMVLGDGMLLSALDISKLSIVPEFVFINCCYLGEMNPESEKIYQERYKVAANLGTQLIEMGVKAVIAAAWAVNDAMALKFAEVFYTKMFEGYDFGESAQIARGVIFDMKGYTDNTWGAYQCYGDQFYRFSNSANGNKQSLEKYLMDEEAEIDLYNLLNDIDVQRGKKWYVDELSRISKKTKLSGLNSPKLTELKALILADLGEYDRAITKFSELFKMEKASFSVSSVERYNNIRVKLTVEKQANGYINKRDAISEIKEALEGLKRLEMIVSTAERANSIGSAYKRLALIETGKKKRESYEKAIDYYSIACSRMNEDEVFYPLSIAVPLSSILNFKSNESHPYDSIDKLNTYLERRANSDSSSNQEISFWKMTEPVNLLLIKLFNNSSLYKHSNTWNQLNEEFKNLWVKAGSPEKKKAKIKNLTFLINVIDFRLTEATVGKDKKRLEHCHSKLLELKTKLNLNI